MAKLTEGQKQMAAIAAVQRASLFNQKVAIVVDDEEGVTKMVKRVKDAAAHLKLKVKRRASGVSIIIKDKGQVNVVNAQCLGITGTDKFQN